MYKERLSRRDRIDHYSYLNSQIEELAANTSEVTSRSAHQANQIWKEVNQTPVDGADTDELLLSFNVSKKVIHFIQETIPQLNIGNSNILEIFLSNLKEKKETVGWSECMIPFDFLRSSVSFQSLNQRRAPRTVSLDKERKQQKRRNVNEVPNEATQPTQLDSLGQRVVPNNHTNLVDRTLCKIYKASNTPVEFYSFALDPHSFSNTIENVFSINILVNDNKMKLLTDQNKECYLEPVAPHLRQEAISRAAKKQTFISIDLNQYNDLIRNLGISSPAIKRQQDHNTIAYEME